MPDEIRPNGLHNAIRELSNAGEAYEGLFTPGARRPPTRSGAQGLGSLNNPHRPSSRAEARALPSGEYFVDPIGDVRVRH